MFIVINNSLLRSAGGFADYEAARLHAEFVVKGDYLIVNPNQRRDLSPYSIGQLGSIIKNMTGAPLPVINGFSHAIELAWKALVDHTEEVTTTAAEYVKKHGPLPKETKLPTFDRGATPYNPEKDPNAAKERETRAATPRPEKAPRTPAAGGVTPTRPREGTTTARVWGIADTEVTKGATGKDLRAAIVAACVAEGIDPSTAATQYSKWKRATGAA